MSGDYDVVRGDSSSSISTTDSFENVATPGASESSESLGSSVTKANGDSVKSSEQVNPIESDISSPIEDINNQFFTPAHSRHAISLLIRFTAAMFVLPLLTMFTMYHYVFRDYFELPPDQAMLYAGLCGIAVVIIIVALFVYIAYREEQEDEKMKKLTKKSD